MSTSDIRPKIADFLTAALSAQGEFTVERVELIHTPRSNLRRESLKIWNRSNEVDRALFDPGRVAVDKLVGAILDHAEQQLETLGQTKPERFKVVVMTANKDRTSFPFPLAPSYDGDDAEIERGDLDPSQVGLVREVMLQNRELHQRMSDMMGQAIQGMTSSIRQLAEQNDRLQLMLEKRDSERQNWLLKVEEAEQKKHDREMEGALIVAETERKELITKKAMGLLSVITSRLLERDDDDKPDPDRKPSELATVLAELGISLTDAQKTTFATSFAVEQQAMLHEVMRLAKKGGGVMLANIFHDLVNTLKKSQVERLMESFTEDQGGKFVKAIQLAEAQATPADKDEPAKKAG